MSHVQTHAGRLYPCHVPMDPDTPGKDTASFFEVVLLTIVSINHEQMIKTHKKNITLTITSYTTTPIVNVLQPVYKH